MKASFHSNRRHRFRRTGAALVLALNAGCMSINNHYSAVDLSEPGGLVRTATDPLSLPMVLVWVVVSLVIGATGCWIVLRLRAGQGKPIATEPPAVAVTAPEPAEVADDDFRSEFHEPEGTTPPATETIAAIPPTPPAKVLR